MNKTVVYIGDNLPDRDAGALRIMSNAKALRDFGFSIRLIGQRENLDSNQYVEEMNSGIKTFIYPSPNSIRSWFSELISIKKFKKIILHEENVCAVIMYNPHAIVFERMKRFCKSNNIRLIADCTEWHTVYHLSGIKKLVKLFDITRRIQKSQKKADGIIVISSYFERMYRDYCRTIIVPPLVDLMEEKWKNKKSLNYNQIRFVYAGRMGIGKDSLNQCISSFEAFTNADFIFNIVGVTREEYICQFPEDEALLEKMGEKIVFHGMLPHTEALEFVKQSHFSLLIREKNRKNDSGFPTKFVESISCGTPVIATDFSDVKSYIERNGLGIMLDSIDNISKGIKKALEMDKSEYYRLRNSCSAMTEFDYRTHSEQLGNFINELVDR